MKKLMLTLPLILVLVASCGSTPKPCMGLDENPCGPKKRLNVEWKL